MRLVARLDPSLLRVCLVHIDPHDRNVLVHDSEFSGLVDWQVSVVVILLVRS
jgi:Ser/Thr protein kinase RdoA (MazF antagonist)